MRKTIYIVILICILAMPLFNSCVEGQQVVFRERVTATGYGRVVSVNSFNHTVDFNGTGLILRVDFYQNKTIDYTEIMGNMTITELYNSEPYGSNYTTYVYKIVFGSDGLAMFSFYLNDGSSERVLFSVTGSGYDYVEGEELSRLQDNWAYRVDETETIEDLMNADYPDTPEGYHDAALDVIDDSTAIRKGPTVFGVNMLFGFAMLFANPFSVIWLLIIVVYLMSGRRKEADILRKIDEEREDMDIDTEELAVAARVAKSRNLGTLSSIKSIAPHLGVSTIIWRDIHKDFTTIAALMAAFDDSVFTEDGRIEGPIAEVLTKWVRNSLTLEQRSKVAGSYRAPTVDDYLSSLKRILQYVSAHLHYPNYEQYIHKLSDSEAWLMIIIKDLRPGGSGVFETQPGVGTPDFSELLDTVN